MSPAAIAVIAAVGALLLGLIVGLLLSRRRRPDDIPAVVQQIDHVRSELQQLSQLFLVPRTRGVVGETILTELLASWLPRKSFQTQHGFSNGTRVDAVIKLGNLLVPVDSKFPLEAIQRFLESEPEAGARLPADIRKSFQKHIADIADRYIRPDEGTMGFALMYIPSEGVYYRLFVERQDELLAMALERNVVPVSPGTLFCYLQTIAFGLRGLSLPEETVKLLGDLARLKDDLASFTRSFQTASTHLRNLTRAFDEAGGKLGDVETSTRRLTDREEE
jgi:DNA recombination protein RmuC